ncbi:hypothetical protein JZU54_04645, partial [bacterium]|nr:hypothetical protein [bacterium]
AKNQIDEPLHQTLQNAADCDQGPQARCLKEGVETPDVELFQGKEKAELINPVTLSKSSQAATTGQLDPEQIVEPTG